MAIDWIVQHQDWQTVSYRDFIAGFWYREHAEPLPEWDTAQGRVPARINHGRWIADCPAPGCGGADCVSKAEPFFFCYRCGNPENGGLPYHVAFPSNALQIEAVLLKRPAENPWRAINRNWSPGETLAQLRMENIALGIEV